MELPLKWYSASYEYNTYEKHVPAPYIRKEFIAENTVSAKIAVSGLGFYELYINGRNITKGLLAPYISNPDDIVYFDEYDITDLIGSGANALGLILGNGMQNAPGGRVWDFDIAKFRGAPRFALKMLLTDKDGNETVIEADESFLWHPSHILFDDLRSGVFCDARLMLSGWSEPGFDDTGWQSVHPAEAPRGISRICEADPIVITDEIPPVEISNAKICGYFPNRDNMKLDTEFRFDFKDETAALYDFGVNTAGIVRLKIKGEKGQRIFVQFCEFINSRGEPSYQNINFYPDGYAQVLHFTCSGGEDVFEPPFTYYGFRYAAVYGLTEQQKKPETLTMLIANSDLKERGSFNCSDSRLNRLYKMSRVSDLANFYYFPTDCPHREKNGWTGDAAVSAEHVMLGLTPENSYREWLRNICAAQGKAGNLPGIIPTGGWGMEWGNGPAWDNVLTELCWQIYRLRGDLSPARECSENILRYLSYISQKRRPDGLIAIGLGDWLQPDRGSGAPTAPLYLTDSVMCVYIAEKSACLFEALGLPLHTEFARSLKKSFKDAIRKNLIDFSTMTVRSRCQTAQAICIYYDIFEDSEKCEAGKVLKKLIDEKDGHFDTGMIGIRVIFRVLSDCGLGSLAFDMITRPDHPSYGSFLERGLTSLAESFSGKETWDDPDSLDHHFMGDIAAWMTEYVAGIRPNPRMLSPDDIDIIPDFLPQLDFAEAYYDAPAGRVEVRWEKTNGGITLSVSCPDAVTGYISLPAGYVFSAPEERYGRLDRSSLTEIKSGKYFIIK